MDIKVGDYIRLKDGYIRKYIKRSLDNHIILDEVYEGFKYLTSIEEKEEIVKHSPNIIDLIEVGDYVNGNEVVLHPHTHELYVNYVFVGGKGQLTTEVYTHKLEDEEIENIVTKEQFKNVMYEV